MLEATKQVQVDPQRKQQDFAYGYNLAYAGQPVKYCGTNADMLRGYKRACNDAAYAETSAYLVGQGVIA